MTNSKENGKNLENITASNNIRTMRAPELNFRVRCSSQ